MSGTQSNQGTDASEPAEVRRDNIWKACAYGDFEQLQRCLEEQPDLVNQVSQLTDIQTT